jgi:prepilin signal peptidase PulO-like enzyme (type II secretory pathway)
MFGSFALVLFDRLGKYPSWTTIKSILTWRSLCDYTGKPLDWHELIPIRSYIKQWGKSRSGKKLSPNYLIAEVGAAAIFLLTALRGMDLFLPWYEILFWAITNTLMIWLIVYDVQKLELHLPLRMIITIRVLLWQFVGLVGAYSLAFFGSIGLGLVFYGLYYGSQYYLARRYGKKQEWLGEGDVYMAFLIGALAPFVFIYQGIYRSWTNSIMLGLYFIIISCFVGLAAAFLLRYYGYKSKQIPFIPAMIIAYYILLRSANNFIG